MLVSQIGERGKAMKKLYLSAIFICAFSIASAAVQPHPNAAILAVTTAAEARAAAAFPLVTVPAVIAAAQAAERQRIGELYQDILNKDIDPSFYLNHNNSHINLPINPQNVDELINFASRESQAMHGNVIAIGNMSAAKIKRALQIAAAAIAGKRRAEESAKVAAVEDVLAHSHNVFTQINAAINSLQTHNVQAITAAANSLFDNNIHAELVSIRDLAYDIGRIDRADDPKTLQDSVNRLANDLLELRRRVELALRNTVQFILLQTVLRNETKQQLEACALAIVSLSFVLNLTDESATRDTVSPRDIVDHLKDGITEAISGGNENNKAIINTHLVKVIDSVNTALQQVRNRIPQNVLTPGQLQL
jgi:hypothetical protein